jgi:CBS domain-containing protein
LDCTIQSSSLTLVTNTIKSQGNSFLIRISNTGSWIPLEYRYSIKKSKVSVCTNRIYVSSNSSKHKVLATKYILKSQSMHIITMTTTVSDLMRKNLFTIEESVSIQNSAMKMKDNKVSSLHVVDSDGKPTGLVTERDLVRKVCINDVRTTEVKNKEIMSAPLITIDSNSSPSIAADLMLKHNVRHLLVVEGNSKDTSKLVGMVTPLDFTKYEEYVRDDEDKESIEMILEYYI